MAPCSITDFGVYCRFSNLLFSVSLEVLKLVPLSSSVCDVYNVGYICADYGLHGGLFVLNLGPIRNTYKQMSNVTRAWSLSDLHRISGA